MWLLTRKKVESWYWWIAANAAAIPAYLSRHYLLNASYHALLLLLSVWIFFKWRKRMLAKRNR